MPSLLTLSFEEHSNDTKLCVGLDMPKERSDDALLKISIYQRRVARYYNTKVKGRSFNVSDLVHQKVTLNTKEPGAGSLGSS